MTPEQKNSIVNQVAHFAGIARTHGNLVVPAIKVDFFRGNKNAGLANCSNNTVFFNEEAVEKYFDNMMNDTVPHEVAHIIDCATNGFIKKKGKWQLHGEKWKSIMGEVFHTAPLRTHNYELVGSGKQYKRFTFSCGCVSEDGYSPRQHEITAIIRNRIMAGRTYNCKSCKQPIEEAHDL